MKGAILSLNHIILDTDGLQFQAWCDLAMYEFGMGLPGKMANQLAGVQRHQALDLILKHFNVTNIDNKVELLNEQYEMYSKVIAGIGEDRLYPRAKQLLNNFYDHYVNIAINDIDEHAKEILQKLKIDDFVDAFVSPLDEENPYLEASQELDVQPAACVGIGSQTNEIKLMNETGVISIGVGDAEELKKAKYQVSQIGDLKYPMIRKVWEDNELEGA
ncbi:HAD hydrolase-like protein [Limosilactobacillus fastidiosus]|uniref:HAD hydrolase-like protein n=2 Tax=Limosilactobacillus fastidiosus TaxID=2759855 RepID=A0A7W3TYF6_9LACO|nr:HAD hydrolase-like protein [Limosilactobacillus fastidiosus]MBB1062492.1 HAD hydrolase-like protein [Limosilactobacillus fastidiosus]MBB1085557.1 HAD hydrolase-like protein [Limosilactobacillus fastidiosus]MCD7086010.1 HAD hydrolase-like protein [Limosilactobacillus fastidiosus]MCD7114346.1 HAD hydrolase-like protein [Limosilactobacillus fastidiosus]MCD7116353.1 HAD hydrolase-like protein [Limosilactobacillus fastidiosus]